MNQLNSTGRIMLRFIFFLTLFSFTVTGSLAQTEQDLITQTFEALKALYRSTDGGNWETYDGRKIRWDTTAAPMSMKEFNDWHGITVSNDGNLRRLSLWRNNLTGSIPPEIGSLANLRELGLGSNDLTGNIPPEIGRLANLEALSLSRNNLTGSIPPEIGNLANLRRLWLSSNDLTGIPSEIGNLVNLEWLILDGNHLRSIPPEIGNLVNLESLLLSDNNLTGSIPPEIGSLANLRELGLGSNDLTGNIPPEIGRLANLEALSLSRNNLTGSIPPEIGRLANLKYLYLSFNKLTGSIPPEIGSLVNLEDLWLDSNNLTGSIPPEIGNLANLRELSLSINHLTGSIPPEIGSLDSLWSLRLGENKLTGSIPRSFLNLLNLNYFYWRNNDGLCAPPDDEFQGWINRFITIPGPTCISTVSVEESNTELPTNFVLQGSYPNPFREAVTLQFDLPYSAYVSIEIIDMMGRVVYDLSDVSLSTGWAREIELHSPNLAPGTYLYRLNVDSPEGNSTHTGRFVKIQ